MAEPAAKTAPPIASVYVREIRSDKGPANSDARDAGMRIEETMSPCRVGEMGSKRSLNWGMTVIGPMEPAQNHLGLNLSK